MNERTETASLVTESKLQPAFDPRTRAAISAVRSALSILQTRAGAMDVREKGPGDFVTATDLAMQALIEQHLQAVFPAIAFVGEEGDAALPRDGLYWLVDPLCGTTNYAAGIPLTAINVALVDRAQVEVAVIGDGASGDLYVAERGRGAWRLFNRHGEQLQVSARSGLISIDPRGGRPGPMRQFGRTLSALVSDLFEAGYDVRMLGTSLVLPYLASGRLAAAVYAQDGLPMHFASGLRLVEEAGAFVSDQMGQGWTLDGPVFVVAATRELHAKLLRLAQEALRQ
jgi:myo-inositol-1(or 4)-monophosphatase